jgi:hypothetical protein
MVRSICSSFRLRRVLTAVAVLLYAAPVFARTNYVDITCTNPMPPYTDWTTAATNIQDAVDATTDGDTVLVNDGVYDTGTHVTPRHSLSNRVVITSNILVKSVNGPAVTIIKGQGPLGNNAVRCVFMTNGVLDGFTLLGGATLISGSQMYDQSGGGVWCAHGVVLNCTLMANSANFNGGGAVGIVDPWHTCTLINCTLSCNSASFGGGASSHGGAYISFAR